VSSNTKSSYSKAANSENKPTNTDNSKKAPTAAEIVATPPQPQQTPTPVAEPLAKSTVEASKPTAVSKVKEDDKKISPPVTTTANTTSTNIPVTKPVEAPQQTTSIPSQIPAETMPTVVAINTDNKMNNLPDTPAVAEIKSAPTIASVGGTESSAKFDEAPFSVKTEEPKLDCWTPENIDAKKRYNREFLLSLKDKKLSKTFPDALANFEFAVMDQNVRLCLVLN